MIIIGILVAIVIFSLVIIIHEFGHFYVARKLGVKVLEFGLGIPPKAKTLFKDKLWTIYTINWLPLWWFVMLDWENDNTKDSKKYGKDLESSKFYNKSYLKKSAILLAWVFMNFLLACIIFTSLFFIWVKPIWVNSIIPTKLESKIIPTYDIALEQWLLIKKHWLKLKPLKDSIAEKSWIKSWDILIWIKYLDKKRKYINWFDEFKSELFKNKEKSIAMLIVNSDGELWKWKTKNIKKCYDNLESCAFKIVWLKVPKNGKIGTYVWENIEINKNFEFKYWVFDSIKYWFYETYVQSILTLKWIWILAKKIFHPKDKQERKQALQQLSGPIWIVDFVSNSLWAWIIFLAIITAIISINLWIFNLLPIPALDWGRFLLLTINKIIKFISRGKINTNNFENCLHLIFFIVLIALSLLIWYNDIEKIINK